ncbi:MAG: APC family permease [Deltaproteobacteria bacterium]|nr:APC family permease [Deltaproteobacteria bacterium]
MAEAPKKPSYDITKYEAANLSRHIDWKGAFVIGLAGTILVTGVTGPVLAGLGSAAIPQFILTTVMGLLLCLFLAELAAMFPDRAGGAPAYAYPAFLKWPKLAKHVNGGTAWAYWLGWNPVIAVNMLLVATYVNALLKPFGVQINPIVLGSVLSIALFIIAYMGIRPGAVAGVVLAALCTIPLVVLAVAPFLFKPELISWSNLVPITVLGDSLFSATGWSLFMQYAFLTTWNAIAMEAAACYVAECGDPGKDAPKAMIAEGLLGVFIYTMVPLSFLLVLGAKKIQADPYAMFVDFVNPIFGRIGVWVVTVMLLAALLLSALNAIMGSARSLYQMSLDGQCPRIFASVNKHNVPAFAMAVNIVLNIGLMYIGTPAFVMVASNVGYLISFVPVLIGYFLLRQDHPEFARPFKLPEFMKWVALVMAGLFFIMWIWGGPLWGWTYYGIGWIILLAYIPLYWYRTRVEDKKLGQTTL